MRARDRAEDRDEHDEHGARRQSVAEELEPDVVGEVHGHDPRTDDGRDEQRGSERLRRKPAREIEGHGQPAFLEPEDEPSIRPISRSLACSAIMLMLRIGSAVNTVMRFRRYLNAVTKAASR